MKQILKLITNGFQSVLSEEAAAISRSNFLDKYSLEPFLLRSVKCEAVRNWDLTFFRENYPNIPERLLSVSTGEEKLFTLKKYLDSIESPIDTNASQYYFKTQFHINTRLKDQVDSPDYFKCWYENYPDLRKRFKLSWIYIGGAGTYSGLHLDVWNTSAWNIVTTGKKLWLFFPPNQSEALYEGRVDPFNPDFEKYPLYRNVKPLMCIQNSGELVYTPSLWWHAVYNLEKGVSITENFINKSNYENVLDYFRNSNKPKSLHSIYKIVNYSLKEIYDNT